MTDHTKFDFHFDVWIAGKKHRAAAVRQVAVTLDVKGTEYTWDESEPKDCKYVFSAKVV